MAFALAIPAAAWYVAAGLGVLGLGSAASNAWTAADTLAAGTQHLDQEGDAESFADAAKNLGEIDWPVCLKQESGTLETTAPVLASARVDETRKPTYAEMATRNLRQANVSRC